VQELGWAFSMPSACDNFSWRRQALWSVYPDTHIGRAVGTARPDTMDVPLTKITRPDAFDFNSTKYNCDFASLTDARGQGLAVSFATNQRHHCRAGKSADGGYTLFVHKQVSPPEDISSNVVRDLYLTLNKGDVVEGEFTIGSTPAK
jgi:hypothetical protein